MPPLLTIGIPTYNRAPLLRDKLEQLLPRLGPEVGALVIDNGSADATPEVIADAARRSPHVRSFRNAANLGCDANYLRVLEMADGEWCWLLGDDEPVDLAALPELLARLRGETADTVHLVAHGHALRPGAPTLFRDAGEFARGFYSQAAFQLMSCNLYRAAAARRHLLEAYRVAGLLHAYTCVGFRLMQRGNGLRVYDLPVMAPPRPRAPAAAFPRWANVSAHLGAWMTLHRIAPPRARRALDRAEARERARVLSATALFDLLGARDAGFRPQHLAWMLELYPPEYYGHVLPVAAARALTALPGASARLVRLGARWVWGRDGDARLRELYGAGDGDLVAHIRDAIARRRARDEAAEASVY